MLASANTSCIPSTTLVTLIGTFIVFTTWLDHLSESLLSWCKTYAVIGENIPTGWYLLARWCNSPLFVCSLLSGDSGGTRQNDSPFLFQTVLKTFPTVCWIFTFHALNIWSLTLNQVHHYLSLSKMVLTSRLTPVFPPLPLFFNKLSVRICSDVRRGRCLEIKFFEFALLIISVDEHSFSKKWTLANIGYCSLLCTRRHL